MSAPTRRRATHFGGAAAASSRAAVGWLLIAVVACGLVMRVAALPVSSRATAAAAASDWRSRLPAATAAASAASASSSVHPEVAAVLELEAEIDAAKAARRVLDGIQTDRTAAAPAPAAVAEERMEVDANGDVHTPVEHDVSEYVRWATYVQRAASLLQQEAVVTAKTHANERARERARARAAAAGDPDADDRTEGRPILNKPQIINHDQLEYKPTTVGSPKPWDWHPGLEGFRPTGGYFMQDPGCDRLMRIWFDTCAFADEPDSVFHHIPDTPIFQIGAVDDQVTTSKYIGNLLKQDFESEPRSHSAKQNVGHFPNGEKEEIPDDGAPDEEAEKAAVYPGF